MSKVSSQQPHLWLQLNYSLVWGGFTLDWYRRLFDDARLVQALFNSLTVAILATLLATLPQSRDAAPNELARSVRPLHPLVHRVINMS